MTYSEDFKRKLLEYKDNGYTYKQLYDEFKISSGVISLWRKRFAETGSLKPKKRNTFCGKINEAELRKAVEETPTAYLHELAEQFGCTKQAVFLALKRMGITREKRPYHHRSKSHNEKIDLDKLKQAVEENPDASSSELAEQFDCTKQEILYTLKRLNLTWKNRHLHSDRKTYNEKIDLDKLKQAVEENPNIFLNELAELFSCSTSAIFYALKRAGITRRKKHLYTGNKKRVEN